MLKAELDVEIIKSAMLAGEVDDAAKWVQKAMKNIEIYKRVTGKTKQDARYRFLQSVMDYLSGNSTIQELRENIDRIPGVRDMLVNHEDYDQFMDEFLYTLNLTVDRYNVKYPSFDGKRCDDK